MARRKGKSRFVNDESTMYRLIHMQTKGSEMGVMKTSNTLSPRMSTSHAVDGMLNGTPDTRPVVQRQERHYDATGILRGVQEGRERMDPIFSRNGMRASVFAGAMVTLILVLSAIALIFMVNINRQDSSNDTLRAQLRQSISSCASLKNQLTESTSQVSAAYKAKEYGLVSAGSIPVITLQAPTDAQISPVSVTGDLSGDSLAIILGN